MRRDDRGRPAVQARFDRDEQDTLSAAQLKILRSIIETEFP